MKVKISFPRFARRDRRYSSLYTAFGSGRTTPKYLAPLLKVESSSFCIITQFHTTVSHVCCFFSSTEVKLRSPLQKDFLAWTVLQYTMQYKFEVPLMYTFLLSQTWDLLQIMYQGFTGLCEEFSREHPGYLISPLRVNGSSVDYILLLKVIAVLLTNVSVQYLLLLSDIANA